LTLEEALPPLRDVALKELQPIGALQPFQRLLLDLPDALLGQVEAIPDFLERLGPAPAQADRLEKK
jgi:hypothetical protein